MIELSLKPRKEEIDLDRVIWDPDYRGKIKQLINSQSRQAERGVPASPAACPRA
jgi:hypothetical protein